MRDGFSYWKHETGSRRQETGSCKLENGSRKQGLDILMLKSVGGNLRMFLFEPFFIDAYLKEMLLFEHKLT